MFDLDMNILLIFIAMGAATYFARVSGYWLSGFWTPKGRMMAALEILPGGVLMSIVAPVAFATGLAETLASLATIAVTLKTGRYFLGVCVGIICVYILRSLGL